MVVVVVVVFHAFRALVLLPRLMTLASSVLDVAL
jgi:hypothetical protein